MPQDDAARSTSLRPVFETVTSEDVLSVLERHLEYEKITNHVRIESNYKHELDAFIVAPTNSLLLSFLRPAPEPKDKKASHKDVPEAEKQKKVVAYRLLVILGLRNETNYSDSLRLKLINMRNQLGVDRIIIWTERDLHEQVLRMLKTQNIDTLLFTDVDCERRDALPFYVPLYAKDHLYDVAANTIATLLMVRLKKLFHLVLSEIAAPVYDELYGQEKVATNEVMSWEDGEVRRLAIKLKNLAQNSLAIDVGCGTGRHSFELADHFDEVYAFDFSPKMISEAAKKKRERDDKKVILDVIDIENESLPRDRAYRADGTGRADLVVSSFGMASFVEDTDKFLRRVSNWLKPGGYALLSFYNADALLMNVQPNWRDTSLSAHLDTSNRTLKVELDKDNVFHIYCKPFSGQLLESIKQIFEIETVSTFPSIMSLMPNSLLSDKNALEAFRRADRLLAAEDEIATLISSLETQLTRAPEARAYISKLRELLLHKRRVQTGYYVLVLCRKQGTEQGAFDRVRAIVENADCVHEFISHNAVHSVADVVKQISPADGQLIKTVIFRDRPSKGLYAVVVPAEKTVDKTQLANRLSLRAGSFVYAPSIDVLKTGFPLGGLAPFGFVEGSVTGLIVDEEIVNSNSEWAYCGCGDNTKTLRIELAGLLRILEPYTPLRLRSTDDGS